MSPQSSNRRSFLRSLFAGASALTVARIAPAQPPPPLKKTALTDRISFISGNVSNIGVIASSDGLMMIDGGAAVYSSGLQEMIAAEIGRQKVEILFNTHWHWDHVGSNELLGKKGTTILAQENTKARLTQKIFVEVWNTTIEPLKPAGLPASTFVNSGKMTFGKEKVEYVHVPLAHTDGDAYVLFPEANVMHTGDLFMNGMYPTIDYTTGGWIGGMASALDTLLAIGDAKTVVIPGHGPLCSKQEMKESRDMLHLIHDRLTALAAKGMSLDEVIAARPTKDLDERWAKGLNGEAFVRAAFLSISRHQARA